MADTTTTGTAAAEAAPEIATHLAPALGAGLGAAIAGAVLWAVVTVTTHYQIGFMAVGVGILVGWVVQRTGRSGAPVLGIAGASLALIGCLLGNLLSAAGFESTQNEMPLMSAVAAVLQPGVAVRVIQATFSPIDLVFYAIALYEGYKIARKPVTD